MGVDLFFQGKDIELRDLRDEVKHLRMAEAILLEKWQGLSDMVRRSYDFTEYCPWCERAAFNEEQHASDCKLVAALAPEKDLE